MLALALSLSVLSAAPRGLAAATPLELVTQVEARLPRWLKGGGDLKALLANQQELGDYLSDFPVPPADRKSMLAVLVKEQSDRPTLDTFTATHALVHAVNRHVDLTFYDEADHSCLVALFSVSDGERDREDRYVLVAGPYTTGGAFEYAATGPGAGVRLEKKGAAWALMSPPPGCRGALERVAAAVYVAEKAYFSERDSYSDSLERVGLDAKSLGGASVLVTLHGAGPTGTFTADVSQGDGVLRVDHQGTTSVVKACTR